MYQYKSEWSFCQLKVIFKHLIRVADEWFKLLLGESHTNAIHNFNKVDISWKCNFRVGDMIKYYNT